MSTGQRIANVLIGIFIGLLTISVTSACLTKSVIKKDIINTLVKYEMMNSVDTENTKALKKVVNGKGVDKVINGIFDDTINSVQKEKYEISDKTFGNLEDYLKNNEELFEELIGEEVDIDEVIDSDDFKDLKEELNQSFQELSELTKEQKRLIILFNKVTSGILIATLIIAIIALLVALYLINKSVLVPMIVMGIDFIVSGVATSSTYIGIKILVNLLTKTSSANIPFDPTRILTVGIIEIIIGILLLVIRKVIKKKNITEENTEKKAKSKNKKK